MNGFPGLYWTAHSGCSFHNRDFLPIRNGASHSPALNPASCIRSTSHLSPCGNLLPSAYDHAANVCASRSSQICDIWSPVVTNPATMLRPHSGEKTAVIRSETNRPALASGCVLGAITDGAIGTSSPEHSSSSVGDQLCHPCL